MQRNIYSICPGQIDLSEGSYTGVLDKRDNAPKGFEQFLLLAGTKEALEGTFMLKCRSFIKLLQEGDMD